MSKHLTGSDKLLSDITVYRTYANWVPEENRREIFEEIVNRNLQMHLKKFPKLSTEILEAYTHVHNLELLPSMRSFQFGGKAIEANNIRLYNCAYAPVESIELFSEGLFLLLAGTGLGFSVQKRHIGKLPKIKGPSESGYYRVHDSTQGWATALKALVDAYYLGQIRPEFDYSDIRAKGEVIKSTGAKAPGHVPLKEMLEDVERRLKLAVGRTLTSLECHDIMCLIAQCVRAGGIRRAALISLFDRDDKDMIFSKSGDWYVEHPHRAMANNSAILPRGEVSKDEFVGLMENLLGNKTGEPGISWTSDCDHGYNPCHEVTLKPHQFCNLVSINMSTVTSEEDFLERAKAATFIATLQASYTDFPFLRDIWRETTEESALIGVSQTGVCDNPSMLVEESYHKAAKIVIETNKEIADRIGINSSERSTTMKPEGSTSCALGTSSGGGARYDAYYLRRIGLYPDDELTKYLWKEIPLLMEIESETTHYVKIPIKSPEGSILDNEETPMDTLNRILWLNKNWIQPGHVTGVNYNNVSCTINYLPEDVKSQTELVEAMWENREGYCGISLFPKTCEKDMIDAGFRFLPHQSITKEGYEAYMKNVKDLDLSKVVELTDKTNKTEQVACGGGSCEII